MSSTHSTRRPVSATAVGAFRMGRGRKTYEVDIHIDGLTFSTLVRDGRVAVPVQRGEAALQFTDGALESEVTRAAIEAAQDAERRGWL